MEYFSHQDSEQLFNFSVDLRRAACGLGDGVDDVVDTARESGVSQAVEQLASIAVAQAAIDVAKQELAEAVRVARAAAIPWRYIGAAIGTDSPAAMRRFDQEAKKRSAANHTSKSAQSNNG